MLGPGLDKIVNPLAELEYIEATEYYRNRSPQLQRRFIDAFEQAIEDILEFPEAVPLYGETIARLYGETIARRKNLVGFPYSIIYVLDPDAIYIIAVAHQRREPFYWLKRLVQRGINLPAVFRQ